GAWRMLQANEPDDFVLATGETHSVQEFLDEAFGYAELDWHDYVSIDERYFRPAEVDVLIGDYSKAREQLGWEPTVRFQELVRMVGEPTTFTKAWFDAFPDAADATPLLARARMLKTEQEVARLRIANEIATQAMQHVRRRLEPGMKESEAAALWQGHVHGQGTARPDVEL